MPPPDFTTIIPTYRRPKELKEAIDSVLSQDVSVEIIVVDDSPEGTAREVVEPYCRPNVVYRKMDSPTGGRPGHVRNRGWREGRGAHGSARRA